MKTYQDLKDEIADEYLALLSQEPEIKEVTMAELEKQYGCKVKIIK